MHTSRWLTHVSAQIIPLNPSLLWAHTLYQAFNASSHHNTSPLSSFAPHPVGHHESLPIFSPTWSLKGARQDLQPNWDQIESTLSSPSFKGCLISLPDSFPMTPHSCLNAPHPLSRGSFAPGLWPTKFFLYRAKTLPYRCGVSDPPHIAALGHYTPFTYLPPSQKQPEPRSPHTRSNSMPQSTQSHFSMTSGNKNVAYVETNWHRSGIADAESSQGSAIGLKFSTHGTE